MALALQGALLVRHGHPAVADAFVASRLDSASISGSFSAPFSGPGGAYGTLPSGTDTAAIVSRATPQILR